MKSKTAMILFFLILPLLSSRPADAGTDSKAVGSRLKPLTFTTLWLPQAQFTGYLVAQEKGFYREAGLDVTLFNGGPDRPPAETLASGKTDLALMFLFKGIEQRARGVKLVNLAQMNRHSALMIVAKKSSGIRVPADLNGRKIGVWRSEYRALPQAFFDKYRLNVEIVPLSSSINLFLWDGIDAIAAMWYNEYHTVLNSGFDPDELTSFFFAEYGLDYPEDGIYALESFVSRNQEICGAFVDASIKGWMFAFANPDSALRIVTRAMLREHVPTNMAHQTWMLHRMKDVIIPEGNLDLIGRLDEPVFRQVAGTLVKGGVIRNVPNFRTFYRWRGVHAEK